MTALHFGIILVSSLEKSVSIATIVQDSGRTGSLGGRVEFFLGLSLAFNFTRSRPVSLLLDKFPRILNDIFRLLFLCIPLITVRVPVTWHLIEALSIVRGGGRRIHEFGAIINLHVGVSRSDVFTSHLRHRWKIIIRLFLVDRFFTKYFS